MRRDRVNELGVKQHDLPGRLTHCPSVLQAATLCWSLLVATETRLLSIGLTGALGARSLNPQGRAREGPGEKPLISASGTAELVL